MQSTLIEAIKLIRLYRRKEITYTNYFIPSVDKYNHNLIFIIKYKIMTEALFVECIMPEMNTYIFEDKIEDAIEKTKKLLDIELSNQLELFC
ncbi:hypothetical protein FACS1894169_09900 [Bacteroidia bacterium]|nr:hypothetical protein FACS1894169_09900 [Bacteroidia bacterium]